MAFTQGHALLIGVGTHQYAPTADVPITVADAEAVAAVLRDDNACGYPEAQVTMLHDDKATKAGILAALDGLAQRAGKDQTVFLFFAGHGAWGTDGHYYLVSHDVRLQGGRVVAGTGVSEGELLAKLKAIDAQRVLMVFNACHSGSLSPTLELDEKLATSNPADDVAAALLGTGMGRIIMTACREEQVSYIGAGKHTIFTQALVDGLRGKGIHSRNGFISAFGLYEQIYETVSEAAQLLHQVQEPELTVLKGVGPFAVALYRGASTLGDFAVDEALPAGAVREVRAAKSDKSFRQRVAGGDMVGRDQTVINTGGGTHVAGNVHVRSGDFVGRDQKITGDVIRGDKIMGDQVKGDKIMEDKVMGEKNTGDSITVGNMTGNTGVAIGREAQAHVNMGAANASATPEAFASLVKELSAILATVPLPADEKQMAQQDLQTVETQLTQSTPKLSMITRGLTGIKSLLETTAAAGTIAVTAGPALQMVQQAMAWAQQLFK